MFRRIAFVLLFVIACVACATPAKAQGLIWSLPADGTWVRYEGTYEQAVYSVNSDSDAQSATPKEVLEWVRKLEIKSVGQEDASYRGQMVPCRWIEIKTVTGKANPDFPLGIDPGPAGLRVCKVLIPESAVLGKVVDARGIPVIFLPIVRGYYKIGDGPVRSMATETLQVYPMFTLLQHYAEIEKQDDEPQSLNLQFEGGPVSAIEYTASQTTEGPTTRSRNEAKFWISSDVPFGLAQWEVRLLRMIKDKGHPRSAFRRESEITVRMQARQTGTDAANEAPSEIVIPATDAPEN